MIAMGPGWRKQHDDIKHEIAAACAECDVECTTEVYGLFSAYIGQNGMTGRKRQGLVPDFMITLKKCHACLAEL